MRGGGGRRVTHRLGHSHNSVDGIVELVDNVARGDPHYCDALCFEPRVPTHVALRAITDVVAHAIDLDREPCLGAIEVENIAAYRVLAAKGRRPRRTLSQAAP
jgi:hypothetical protein